MPEMLVGAGIGISLIVYALTGGADYGGGVWDFFATGPRALRQRQAIARAIGPIWEANHVWLILVVVLLFTGFPSGFSAMMTALNIPLTVMLLGIVCRGTAFVFREYDVKSDRVHQRWSRTFGTASVVTPFVQGVTLGAFATGQIHVVDGRVTTGFFAGWLTPFALSCGIFALGLFAFLAATYLTVDSRDDTQLQNDFRARALWAGVLLAPVALAVLLTARTGAPELYQGVTRWWAPWLLTLTSVCAVTALGALWAGRYEVARAAAIGQVTLVLTGWSVAQFPNLIAPDVTIANAHAPEITLRLLLVALAVGAVVLVPSLFFLFRLFKSARA